MINLLTKKEQREHLKELLKFCKENQALMWNYMLLIKKIREEPKDKILQEKLKKQARDYQMRKFPTGRRNNFNDKESGYVHNTIRP